MYFCNVFTKMHGMRLLLILISYLLHLICAELANLGRIPLGVNPTLYDAKIDPIIQLDEMSFNDTVYCRQQNQDCFVYIVEFYSDWCGHCRAYAQTYKGLARDIQGWNKIVKVAAVNCADPLNEATCQANGVFYFPLIKYFPRLATNPEDANPMKALQSVSAMRDLATETILGEYSANRYPDWPDFALLGNLKTFSELWKTTQHPAPLMVVVFEDSIGSMIGPQLLLDMTKYDDRIQARRCVKNHPLTEELQIRDFPTLAVFKHGERTPLMIAELRRLLFSDLEKFLISEDFENQVEGSIHNYSICEVSPKKCREMFYVSETDILKAMRYAAFNEVVRSRNDLKGDNLTAIRNFLDLLAKNLPRESFYFNETDGFMLNNTERSALIFASMRDFLDHYRLNGSVPVSEYKEEFEKLEEQYGYPFPTQAEWEHCAGSNPQFRGYTCGLWTSFHTLTVQAYKNNLNDTTFVVMGPLSSIRDWVDHFFGCRHCRDHFIRMTTKKYRMETHVHRPEDVFMYLWQAHNIVNDRLRGRDTEDPEFPKRQFPAQFLCSECRYNGHFDEDEVKIFMLSYYSAIKPVSPRS